MKKILAYLTVALLGVAVWSCGGKDEPSVPETPVQPTKITVSGASELASMAASGGDVTLSVTTPSRPSVSGAPNWIVTDITYDASKFTARVKITVLVNNTYEERTAALAITASGKTASVTVKQSGKELPAFSCETTALTFGALGGSSQFSVTAPSKPSATADGWLSVSIGDLKDFQAVITVKAEENTTGEDRSGRVTVSCGDASAVITVTQPKKATPGDISKSVVTENPTAAVTKLYDYLLSVYGEKTISAIMANVNWNHEEADKVFKVTGKYPAINCYDFIHILYSGANWINYSDLTPVTEWVDAGGIVSLMWHFNVPKTQSGGTSEVTCTPSETTFRAKNVFTEGSWENKWFYEQMDKVADVILALQQKGIAALWRPFHEAAGNATRKQQASWTKSWFWWGYDGAETYKKLWTTMFDYFKSKGIRNLIWIWTTQNYNGDSTLYDLDKDWYPGDAYVDIVARDLYGATSSQNRTEFTEIQSFYPTKMVTLGECGKDGDTAFCGVSDFWNAGAKWLYFMPWYGSNMPSDAWWKAAMGSSAVVDRASLPSLK